jgi:hypothetical protein
MGGDWATPNAEPTLDELLSEPIVRLLMQGDRTGESEVRQLIVRVQTAMMADVDGASPATKRAGKAKNAKVRRFA